MAEVALKEVLEETRRSAVEDYERSMGPQFRDDRCKACGHTSEMHHGGQSKCFECPVERKCQRYVIGDAVP